jgi:hypothetical protein
MILPVSNFLKLGLQVYAVMPDFFNNVIYITQYNPVMLFTHEISKTDLYILYIFSTMSWIYDIYFHILQNTARTQDFLKNMFLFRFH